MHIGKWHLGLSGGMAPHDQGFDDKTLLEPDAPDDDYIYWFN